MREMRGLRRKERAEKIERATAHLKSDDRRIESKKKKQKSHETPKSDGSRT
jgi:hypothetical protein